MNGFYTTMKAESSNRFRVGGANRPPERVLVRELHNEWRIVAITNLFGYTPVFLPVMNLSFIYYNERRCENVRSIFKKVIATHE